MMRSYVTHARNQKFFLGLRGKCRYDGQFGYPKQSPTVSIQMSIEFQSPATTRPSDEDSRTAEDASHRLETLLLKHRDRFQVSPAGNPGDCIEIPFSAIRLLLDVLTRIAHGDPVSFNSMDDELCIQHSAEYLNVSSSYLGKLPSRGVGQDRRVLFRDLLEYKTRSDAQRREALEELAALGQEIGEGY
jgi:hypothetical protein